MGGLDSVSSAYNKSEKWCARSEGVRSTFRDPILTAVADKERARQERLLKKENYEYSITQQCREERSPFQARTPSRASQEAKKQPFVPDSVRYWHDTTDCRQRTKLPPLPKLTKEALRPRPFAPSTPQMKLVQPIATTWGPPPATPSQDRLRFRNQDAEYGVGDISPPSQAKVSTSRNLASMTPQLHHQRS